MEAFAGCAQARAREAVLNRTATDGAERCYALMRARRHGNRIPFILIFSPLNTIALEGLNIFCCAVRYVVLTDTGTFRYMLCRVLTCFVFFICIVCRDKILVLHRCMTCILTLFVVTPSETPSQLWTYTGNNFINGRQWIHING